MSSITLVFYLGLSNIVSIGREGLDERRSYNLALRPQSFPASRRITVIAFSFLSNYNFI